MAGEVREQSAAEQRRALRAVLRDVGVVASAVRQDADAPETATLRETPPAFVAVAASEVYHDGNRPACESVRAGGRVEVNIIATRINDQQRVVAVNVVVGRADNDLAQRRVARHWRGRMGLQQRHRLVNRRTKNLERSGQCGVVNLAMRCEHREVRGLVVELVGTDFLQQFRRLMKFFDCVKRRSPQTLLRRHGDEGFGDERIGALASGNQIRHWIACDTRRFWRRRDLNLPLTRQNTCQFRQRVRGTKLAGDFVGVRRQGERFMEKAADLFEAKLRFGVVLAVAEVCATHHVRA